MTGADESYLEAERKERLAEMAAQRERYRKARSRAPVAKRVAILVDDGLATGATMIAAIQTTALAGPASLVVAVPVSPPETVAVIEGMKEVDEVICLETPAWFGGVGQFYEDFTQVDDDEVAQILKEFA
jgi:predicted phosphoribosyltransferase